jgi:SAM-dependent methyltransferase
MSRHPSGHKPRSVALRQASPRRRPWHLDYHHTRLLLRAVAGASRYAHGRLLDAGCGRRPYAPWLSRVSAYVGIDASADPGGPDLVALAAHIPFASASFDTVLSTQTLEHVEAPHLALAEMARVLRPGGHLILSAPQSWRLHEEPYDFFRFTRYGLTHLLEQQGMEVLVVEPIGGVWLTVGQMVNNAVHVRLCRLPVYARYLIYLASNALFGLLDEVWQDHGDTTNYLVVARKPLP